MVKNKIKLLSCFIPLIFCFHTIAENKINPVIKQQSILPKPNKTCNLVSFNQRKFTLNWSQIDQSIAIADTGLMQLMGIELLDTNSLNQQPIQWFADHSSILAVSRDHQYRYLDLTNFAKQQQWEVDTNTNCHLKITTPIATVNNLKIEDDQKIIIQLNRPTIWQLRYLGKIESNDDDPTQVKINKIWAVSIDAQIADNFPQQTHPKIAQIGNQVFYKFTLPSGARPRVTTNDQNQIIIDLQSDYLTHRNILWAPGITWQQKSINNFPTVSLTIDLQDKNLKLQTIRPNLNSQIGTANLNEIAQKNQVAAAINGGFFNRIKQLPVGAIKSNNQWLSGPILNRGVIAWNNQGLVKFDRLTLQENLTINSPINNQSLTLNIDNLNSGYTQKGIYRYTKSWGPEYTTLTDEEVIILVDNNQVIKQFTAGKAGEATFTIPPSGYLLTIRDKPEYAPLLSPGTKVSLVSNNIPGDFNNYPDILGGGPLLIKNGEIVLDGAGEKFSDNFIKQTAIRSAIGLTNQDKLIIVAVHNPVNGPGPTLAEMAIIMQKLGSIEALNLDGGSSTNLYLGGQRIDAYGHNIDGNSQTIIPVHNGLGIFLNQP